VDFASALGTLSCNDVATLDVVPDNPALPPSIGVACSAGAVSFVSGIQPGQTYGFSVKGHATAGGPVAFGGRCFTQAEASLIVPVSCDALSASGAASFDVTSLLAAKGIACAAGVQFSVTLAPDPKAPSSGPIASGAVPCGQQVQLGPLSAGPHSASLTVAQVPAGSTTSKAILSATCTVQVTPGDTVAATCAATSP
jgi:hypothetical protein